MSDNIKSIGELNERSLHRDFKELYSLNGGECEVKLEGFTVDIFDGETVTEIQSTQFRRLKKKLSVLSKKYKIKVVYPIARVKYLSWIDENTGEIVSKRKSPKRGNFYDILPQIYELIEFIQNENVLFESALTDVEEYRVLNGFGKDKKRRAEHYDKISDFNNCEAYSFSSVEDYINSVSYLLPDTFTSDVFAKRLKRNMRFSYRALKVLESVGTVKRIGKDGRKILYEIQK